MKYPITFTITLTEINPFDKPYPEITTLCGNYETRECKWSECDVIFNLPDAQILSEMKELDIGNKLTLTLTDKVNLEHVKSMALFKAGLHDVDAPSTFDVMTTAVWMTKVQDRWIGSAGGHKFVWHAPKDMEFDGLVGSQFAVLVKKESQKTSAGTHAPQTYFKAVL